MNNQPICKQESGKIIPIINLSDCESKTDCVDVCPYNVFEVREMTENEKKTITSFKGKAKLLFHGTKKGVVVLPENCHSCGLCVTACPEDAITLKSSQMLTKENFMKTVWLFL